LKYDYRQRYAQESNVKRTPLELQNDFTIGSNNILTAGVFLNKERITAETDDWATLAFKTGSDYTQQQRAVYVQDQAFFLNRKLSAIVGMRYDYWKFYNIYDSSSTNQHPDGSNKNAVTFRMKISP
jgi:iron complex outermembrane receptor protein